MESSPQNGLPSFSSAPSLLKESEKFNLNFLKKYIGLQASEFFFVDDEGEFVEELRRFLVLKVLAKDMDASILSPSAFIDKGWHAFLLFPIEYSSFCNHILPPDIPSPRLIGHNPFGMFPSYMSGGGGGGGGGGGSGGGGGGGGENSGMGSRDVSGRSERYFKTYQMYLSCFRITPPSRYWPSPSPFLPSSSPSSSSSSSPSQKKRTREVDHLSSPTKRARSTTITDTNTNNTNTDTDIISLIVVTQDGNETHFKIRETTPLGKLMDAWCQRENVEREDYYFLCDGTRLRDEHTPAYLGMEDGDLVDASLIQHGC